MKRSSSPRDAHEPGSAEGPPPGPPPSLLSSVHGRIRTVLFTIPFWVVRYRHQVEIGPYATVFEALLGGLAPDVERVVATRAEEEGKLRAWLDEIGVSGSSVVVTVPDAVDFTMWAQDACAVLQDGDDVRLVAPASFERFEDAGVVASVASALGLPIETSGVRFQGGNLLVGDDFWLLGADAVSATLAEEGIDEADEAVAALSATLEGARTLHLVGNEEIGPASVERPLPSPRDGEEEAWVERIHFGSLENSRQPLFDLDTFLSLCGRGGDGRYRVLVGDPAQAARIVGEALPDHAAPELFDEVAARLERLGFAVTRNPLPLVHHDDRVTRTRTWYHATSNNVLAEIDGGRRTVWMPTYGGEDHPGLRATDARNREIWEGMGFEVHALPDFHAFARGLGAAHCLHKCLRRDRDPTPGSR